MSDERGENFRKNFLKFFDDRIGVGHIDCTGGRTARARLRHTSERCEGPETVEPERGACPRPSAWPACFPKRRGAGRKRYSAVAVLRRAACCGRRNIERTASAARGVSTSSHDSHRRTPGSQLDVRELHEVGAIGSWVRGTRQPAECHRASAPAAKAARRPPSRLDQRRRIDSVPVAAAAPILTPRGRQQRTR